MSTLPLKKPAVNSTTKPAAKPAAAPAKSSNKSPAITPTIHITKPTDKVPGVDVYTDKRDTPINDIAKKIDSWTKGFLDDYGAVVPKGVLLDAVKGATEIATGAMSMGEVADNVLGVFKFSKAELKAMGAGASTEILRNLGYPEDVDILVNGAFGIPGAQPMENFIAARNPRVRALLADGSFKKLIDGDFESAQDLAKLLGGVAGSEAIVKVFSGSAQFAIFSSIVNSARALNMPEIYDTIRQQIKDDEDRREFLLQGASQAANAGDIAYLKLVIDESSIGRLKTIVPDIIPQLLAGYSRRSADSPVDAFSETLSFLNRIDPNWSRIQVRGVWHKNLGVLFSASNDALDALKLIPEYRTVATIASDGKHREESALVIFKERYPKSTLAAS